MEWKKISERVQQVGYKKVTLKDYEMPDGTIAEFTTWGRATKNVAVIAITQDNKALIAKQFRPGPERVLSELPGGGAEGDEEPAAAALRELEEETGYTTDQPLEFLGTACRDAYMCETNYYFLATNCHKVQDQNLDDDEHVTPELVTIKDLIVYAKTAQMSDGIGVFLAYDRLQDIDASS